MIMDDDEYSSLPLKPLISPSRISTSGSKLVPALDKTNAHRNRLLIWSE